MYGVIGKMSAQEGRREELLQLLMTATGSMPGCLNYVIARDPADPNGLWITEVWDHRDSHAASLKLPEVVKAITAARPLIAGFSHRVETEPVGGVGLSR